MWLSHRCLHKKGMLKPVPLICVHKLSFWDLNTSRWAKRNIALGFWYTCNRLKTKTYLKSVYKTAHILENCPPHSSDCASKPTWPSHNSMYIAKRKWISKQIHSISGLWKYYTPLSECVCLWTMRIGRLVVQT